MSHNSLYHDPLVVLGTGYTGRRIYHQAREAGWNVFATSRMPDVHLSDISPAHRIHFDLTQPETWRSIPTPAHLIWCFPATPLPMVQKFFTSRPGESGRILVMGSTSAYGTNCGAVTEQTPVNMDLPRVQGEEYLRTQLGAVVMRLAGLYGPGRHVLDWMRKGRIRNTPKWVNLLHVEDAAGICLRALERAQNGTTYLASDGTPRTWSEIFSIASEKWSMLIPPPTPLREIGKQVSIHKLLTTLHYTLRFPDLYQALDDIERHSSS
ncbi:MAG: NAD(P)-dependent oxidoreductase [Nitrospirales bacterium]|nr:MAG: NAD(P)-dependent oxidoreductase [Nitrospirales bacterium]